MKFWIHQPRKRDSRRGKVFIMQTLYSHNSCQKKKVAINSSWSIFPTRCKNDGDVVMLHPFFITMITRAVAIKLSCCSQRSCSNFFFFRFPFSCFTSSSLRLLTRRRRRRNREKHEWWKCVRDRFTLNDDDEFSLLHWEFFPLSY